MPCGGGIVGRVNLFAAAAFDRLGGDTGGSVFGHQRRLDQEQSVEPISVARSAIPLGAHRTGHEMDYTDRFRALLNEGWSRDGALGELRRSVHHSVDFRLESELVVACGRINEGQTGTAYFRWNEGRLTLLQLKQGKVCFEAA